MADRIKKTPNYSQYKFALLGILLCDISDNGSLNDKNSVGGFFPEGMSFQEAPWQTETYAGYQYVLKNLRAVFESRGISTDSWFFNRVPGDHNNMGTPYSASILAAELVRDDPELLAFTDGLVDGNYYGVSFQSVGIKRPEEDNFFFTSCGALQQRSLEALKGLSCESAEQYSASEIIQDGQKLVEAAMRQQDHAPPKALRLCIGCHDNPTGNNVGPAISFNNREKLKQHFSGAKGEEHYKDLVRRINEDRRSTERMPPTSVLTDQEKIDIMSYINRLFN